jgi:hypothetical protein
MKNKNAQAAVELAVFGAIVIFILGTIVRSAAGNGFSQSESFKAMRMALLASWQGAKSVTGAGALANTSRNSASILFVEDRLSPDAGKYGDLDRTPLVSSGSGTFSYNLYYAWQQGQSTADLVPIMDIYVNGVHIPLTTAAFTTKTITRPQVCPQQKGSCYYNQCERNRREWAGGNVTVSQFYNIIPPTTLNGSTGATIVADATAILNKLAQLGNVTLLGSQGATVNSPTISNAFVNWLAATYDNNNVTTAQGQANQVQSILQNNQTQYKLFYTMAVNGSQAKPLFLTTAPGSCSGTNNALCSSLTVLDAKGNLYTNASGYMQYDLLRLGNYTFPLNYPSATYPAVSTKFPVGGPLRKYVSWQWAATPGTDATSIGLDASSNQYPQYDIDGRLKPVTIYAINQNPNGTPTVTYEDFQGGDIDGGWDANSCTPKPGLLPSSQIFTFTQNGTHLKIMEGKLYNPETNQFVRSVNSRDTIDLIQRMFQLSNNTGRFCNGATRLATVANDGVTPNPVEVCIPPGAGSNCFSSEQNIKSICFDENDNMLFVRSRLQDTRGRFWVTNTNGQYKVK